MIGSIELKGYRGFAEFRLQGLARVNLIVGKNNCGKTSLLEAVHLLAAETTPATFWRLAVGRGEIVVQDKEAEAGITARGAMADISHFFHGHAFGCGSSFRIAADNGIGGLRVQVVVTREAEPSIVEDETASRSPLSLEIEPVRAPARPRVAFPVTEEGGLAYDTVMRLRRFTRKGEEENPTEYISPDSLQPRQMGDMWNLAVVEGREREVIDVMRILEEDLQDVVFLAGETSYRRSDRAGVLLGFKGMKRRLPLGSYGEGMRRLLALALALIRTRDGFLLVDEIDTGLHYSIMEDMWKLLVHAARQYNIQVFATTHSFDCVRGLASLCDNYPDLREEVSLQKIDRHLDASVALDGESVATAISQELETR